MLSNRRPVIGALKNPKRSYKMPACYCSTENYSLTVYHLVLSGGLSTMEGRRSSRLNPLPYRYFDFSDSSSSLASYSTYSSTAPLIANTSSPDRSPTSTGRGLLTSKFFAFPRLARFKHIFPHDDGAQIEGLEQTYDELLEMIRSASRTDVHRYGMLTQCMLGLMCIAVA
jgi:hypothetical protein